MNSKMENTIKVWDLPVRLFHWSLVVSFACAYLAAEFHFKEWHVLLGYVLCGLVAFRIVWGFAGSTYAKFKSFVFSPAETLGYLRDMKAGHPRHYYGHNPAGALMVFGLLALLLAMFASGLATLAAIDFEGPFLSVLNVEDETSYSIRHIHEFFAEMALVLIPLHILGVIGGSLQHKENLVRAMITGKKVAVDSSSDSTKR